MLTFIIVSSSIVNVTLFIIFLEHHVSRIKQVSDKTKWFWQNTLTFTDTCVLYTAGYCTHYEVCGIDKVFGNSMASKGHNYQLFFLKPGPHTRCFNNVTYNFTTNNKCYWKHIEHIRLWKLFLETPFCTDMMK